MHSKLYSTNNKPVHFIIELTGSSVYIQPMKYTHLPEKILYFNNQLYKKYINPSIVDSTCTVNSTRVYSQLELMHLRSNSVYTMIRFAYNIQLQSSCSTQVDLVKSDFSQYYINLYTKL